MHLNKEIPANFINGITDLAFNVILCFYIHRYKPGL